MGDEKNVAAQNPELVIQLLGLFLSARVESKDFPFQLPEKSL